MRILISNDDGIFAPGIAALVRAFSAAGHEVFVVAPDAQRSAASHSMTLSAPLYVREERLEGAARAWAASGTPVDCVKLGLHTLCPQAELVVSGVNHGYNAGIDVLYSGTVAAAMEGALNGRPAIAVSLSPRREDTYDLAAELAVRMLEHLREHPLPRRTVLNLNYPAADRALGVRVVPAANSSYTERYVPDVDDKGRPCYRVQGTQDPLEPGDDDCSLLAQGYATVTLLGPDLTNAEATAAFKTDMNA